MKVLWLTNMILPNIAEKISSKKSPKGGWMVGLYEKIIECKQIDLIVVFPQRIKKKTIQGKLGKVVFFGFYNSKHAWKYDNKVEEQLLTIIKDVKPDIVHIFGTEFPHALAMTKVFNSPSKTVISIQGLVSICYSHYYASLPKRITNGYTIRDLLRLDNIKLARRKFKIRGKFEIQALKSVNHVIGRTDWDKACTEQINPNAEYHFCNEILRETFYNNKWNIASCERFSIFISQSGYPIKGLHYVIEALPEIIKKFPKTHLFVAGHNITKSDTFKEKMSITSYGKYIKSLINKLNLKQYITFTGNLDEEQMCKQFLKSHVFVSPSTIENESNSISEAKLLGVPVIASFVGGVTNRVRHHVDGFLYQHDASYMLAYYICELFGNDKLAVNLSKNGIEFISNVVNRELNSQTTVDIYKGIYENQNR